MRYESTRGSCQPVSSTEAIKLGIAPDGGLFVPNSIPPLSPEEISGLTGLDYASRAAAILPRFLTDFSPEAILAAVNAAYSTDRFTPPGVAPLHRLAEGEFFLELWHSPTCAFKDVALQLLPQLLTRAMAQTGEESEIVILVATSGDTGKAALEGFRDVPGTRIIVFYPEGGVSEVQRLQMATQEGNNVRVVAVRGNFDDTQNGVKAIFTDTAYGAALARRGFKFSSANSINWGRLVPQIVYYFSAYADLLQQGDIAPGEAVNFVVPTGNFGNILAAYYARAMGLPVHRLILAANANSILADFVRTGVYDKNRPFLRTASPSMDILISSNLERLLYELAGRDGGRVSRWMEEMKTEGVYRLDDGARAQLQSLFWADSATDAETFSAIRDTFYNFGYTMDTHTAVGKWVYDKYRRETGDQHQTVIVSTASPFKFNASVVEAIAGPDALEGKSEFALLHDLALISGLEIPESLRGLDEKPRRHDTVCDRGEMKETVSRILGL